MMAKIATKTIEEILREPTARMALRSDLQRMLLFGSYARGDAAPDSDVDIIAIVDPGEATHRIIADLHQRLHPFGLPVDILAYTSEQVREMEEDGNFFWARIKREAKELYARGST
jgi:uncharacterized protein